MHTEDLPAGLANRPSATKTSPEAPSTTDPDRPSDRERPRLDLTASQILAGVAASVTAAVLGSRLGVAGTVLGAALASGVSIAAGAVYAHSIRATRHQVRRVVGRLRPDATDAAQSPATDAAQSPAAAADPHPVGGPRRSRAHPGGRPGQTALVERSCGRRGRHRHRVRGGVGAGHRYRGGEGQPALGWQRRRVVRPRRWRRLAARSRVPWNHSGHHDEWRAHHGCADD